MPPGTDVQLISSEAGLTDEMLRQAADLVDELVADGAALGWVEAPGSTEVARLLRRVVTDARRGEIGRAHV